MKPSRRKTLVPIIVALAMIAAACGGSGSSSTDAADVEGITTNDGGVIVKPPDVLSGEAAEDPVALDLPPLVDGLDPTPLTDFVWFDGSAGSTAEFVGQPTVLNFWASTCAACIAEMPEFEEVHQAVGDSVRLVGMNVADTRADADRLAEQTGVTYALAADERSAVFRSFLGFAMPTTVFLNEQGQVAFAWTGILTGDELRILIDRHILPGSL